MHALLCDVLAVVVLVVVSLGCDGGSPDGSVAMAVTVVLVLIVLAKVQGGAGGALVGSKFGVGNLAFQFGRQICHAKSRGFCQISHSQFAFEFGPNFV